MASTVKLQKIGNSIRATIPKEVVEELSLEAGQEMTINTIEDTLLLKKRSRRKLSDLYGRLRLDKGKVKDWPTPEEIKSIWG